MQVLVTGASGFVGDRLTRALLSDGQRVVVGARVPTRVEALRTLGAEVRTAELADPDSLAQAAEGCERVYHCAGEASHAADPEALRWLHVAGVENLMAAARHVGVQRVVLLSCADTTLCNLDRMNWREQQPLTRAPIDAWSRSKLMGEEVALQQSTDALQVTAIRPAFLWGAGDSVNLPQLCREALAGGIRLFGSGDALFSAAHVDNVVHAMRLASAAAAAPGQAFHISDGTYQTASEFFGALAESLGSRTRRGVFGLAYASAQVRQALGRASPTPADVARRARACLLDIQRAINDLGYKPVVEMDAGMAELAAWVRDEGGLARVAARLRTPADRTAAATFTRLAAG